MKRALRFGLPMIAAVGVLIALGVLLAIRPWSDEEAVQERAAQPAEFGLCNVSVGNIPPGVEVSAFVSPIAGPEGSPEEPGKSGELIFLRIAIPLPEGAKRPTWVPGEIISSNVLIHAYTGEVYNEAYKTPADEAMIKPVLASLQVGPWKPGGPAWPRTDTPPSSDIVELNRPWELPPDDREPILRYRMPERGSGMITGRRLATARSGEPLLLRAYTCDSIVEVYGPTGEIVREEVTPEEEAMFQRFLDEVVPP